MNHFGIAIGAITAGVIGGALLLDRIADTPEHTAARTATPPAVATESTVAPPLASVASTRPESALVVADAGPALEKASGRSAARPAPPATRNPPKAVATTNGSSALNGDTQISVDTASSSGNPSPSTSATADEKPD